MKTLKYKRTWFRYGSFRPGYIVYRFEQFTVRTTDRYKRSKQ